MPFLAPLEEEKRILRPAMEAQQRVVVAVENRQRAGIHGSARRSGYRGGLVRLGRRSGGLTHTDRLG